MTHDLDVPLVAGSVDAAATIGFATLTVIAVIVLGEALAAGHVLAVVVGLGAVIVAWLLRRADLPMTTTA